MNTTTETVKIRFVPQAWINDYAVEVDPLGPTEFDVPMADVKGLEDDTYESDDLRFHANAPEWIREWSGPFYIAIDDAPTPATEAGAECWNCHEKYGKHLVGCPVGHEGTNDSQQPAAEPERDVYIAGQWVKRTDKQLRTPTPTPAAEPPQNTNCLERALGILQEVKTEWTGEPLEALQEYETRIKAEMTPGIFDGVTTTPATEPDDHGGTSWCPKCNHKMLVETEDSEPICSYCPAAEHSPPTPLESLRVWLIAPATDNETIDDMRKHVAWAIELHAEAVNEREELIGVLHRLLSDIEQSNTVFTDSISDARTVLERVEEEK